MNVKPKEWANVQPATNEKESRALVSRRVLECNWPKGTGTQRQYLSWAGHDLIEWGLIPANANPAFDMYGTFAK